VRYKKMRDRKIFSFVLAIVLPLATPFVIKAQQASPGETARPVTAAATARPLAELLPDKLAGIKAAGSVKEYAGDNLAELVADKAAVYQEYLVRQAVSRQYAETRVDIFETENPYAAFGLFTYHSGPRSGKAVSEEIGYNGARIDGGLVFWKENYFVRVMNANQQLIRRGVAAHSSLAREISDEIILKNAEVARPPLVESLPAGSTSSNSVRYFLGPESLNAYVEHGREMFGFAGDAEAVMAEYDAAANPAEPLKLVIVEYHTPQFAYDAMARVNQYIATLPEDGQNRILVKREGNYIVEAISAENREAAQALVDAVKYPYGVKWLRDPRLPSNDPFRIQKAAQMLLSTFTLLGLLLLSVVVGGSILGTSIFLKRRKQQQEIFSNAGGMLRLEIDPFETRILGLPPRREDG
jgi:hypothetical protein